MAVIVYSWLGLIPAGGGFRHAGGPTRLAAQLPFATRYGLGLGNQPVTPLQIQKLNQLLE
jgi:hypothetical protein